LVPKIRKMYAVRRGQGWSLNFTLPSYSICLSISHLAFQPPRPHLRFRKSSQNDQILKSEQQNIIWC
jgi:hypothetical protein